MDLIPPTSIQATSLHGIRVASSRLLAQDRISLLAQSNPDPEPCHRLDKDKCKEQSVLEHVSAPASWAIRWVMCARVRHGTTRGLVVDRRRWTEEEDVSDETEREE